MKEGVKNFAEITGKHLCWSLFFNKVRLEACNFIQKETPTRVFCCKFCKIFKSTYFVEYLRTAASEDKKIAWKSYYEKLLNKEFTWDRNCLSQVYVVSSLPCLIDNFIV